MPPVETPSDPKTQITYAPFVGHSIYKGQMVIWRPDGQLKKQGWICKIVSHADPFFILETSRAPGDFYARIEELCPASLCASCDSWFGDDWDGNAYLCSECAP